MSGPSGDDLALQGLARPATVEEGADGGRRAMASGALTADEMELGKELTLQCRLGPSQLRGTPACHESAAVHSYYGLDASSLSLRVLQIKC